MYKYQTGPEPDHSGYEWVEPNGRCENCGQQNSECECGDVIDDDHPDAPLDELNYRR